MSTGRKKEWRDRHTPQECPACNQVVPGKEYSKHFLACIKTQVKKKQDELLEADIKMMEEQSKK